MSHLILQPTVTAEWQALIKEAQGSCRLTLSEDLESYLIFLLVRFTEKPELAKNILGLEFLNGTQAIGYARHSQLRDVGDKCLLISGLFPGRAEKRRVNISYFIELGQTAYAILGTGCKQKLGELYQSLEHGFINLMDVLQVARELAPGGMGLTPLQAEELCRNTSSSHAKVALKNYTCSMHIHNHFLSHKKH